MNNQYKLYCINENKNLIIKGFNTNDKRQIQNEVKSYLSKVYPGKKLNENFIITSNPQGYGLNPKDSSSWINVKKEMKKEAIVRHLTDKIYESITKNVNLPEKVNQKNNNQLSEVNKKKRVSSKKFQEDIEKLVAQSINENLNEAYVQAINEAYGDKIGTAFRNIGGAVTGSGTIPPKTYAAARQLGRAFTKFKGAWQKWAPFLGNDPNKQYPAQTELTGVEAAIKKLPRLQSVADVSRPRRQELVGDYFVSRKHHDDTVREKAAEMSAQDIEKAHQTADELRQEILNLRTGDAKSQKIIQNLTKGIDDFRAKLDDKDTDIAVLEQTIEGLKNNVKTLEQQGAVDREEIAGLNQTIEQLLGLVGKKRKEKIALKGDVKTQKDRATSAEAELKTQKDRTKSVEADLNAHQMRDNMPRQ